MLPCLCPAAGLTSAYASVIISPVLQQTLRYMPT